MSSDHFCRNHKLLRQRTADPNNPSPGGEKGRRCLRADERETPHFLQLTVASYTCHSVCEWESLQTPRRHGRRCRGKEGRQSAQQSITN